MKIKVLVTVILIIIVFALYLKIGHDEKEQYYNEQKERITIYMKHNVKGYKNISFTNFKENPMDGYSISGYINNDKKLSFTAGIRSIDDFQFDTDILIQMNWVENLLKILSQFPKLRKSKIRPINNCSY